MNHERNYKRWGIEQKKSKTLIKRIENRKHLYGLCQGDDTAELCNARIIRRIFQRSEQGEARRPGDIFFALAAIENLIFAEKTRTKFVWTSAFFDDGGKCMQWLTEYTDNQGYGQYNQCISVVTIGINTRTMHQRRSFV